MLPRRTIGMVLLASVYPRSGERHLSACPAAPVPAGPANLRHDDVDLVAALVDTGPANYFTDRVLRTYGAVPRKAPAPTIALLHAHRHEVRKIAALGLWSLVQFPEQLGPSVGDKCTPLRGTLPGSTARACQRRTTVVSEADV